MDGGKTDNKADEYKNGGGKIALYILASILLLLTSCKQYVFVPIDVGDGSSTEYFVDDYGKIWELSYNNKSGEFTRSWTKWYRATPETAQDVLDRVRSGENVYFDAGTYSDTYYIRASRETSEIHRWDNQDSTSSVIGELLTLDDLKTTERYQYIRYLKNMEFRADDNAVFTGNFVINNAFLGNGAYDAVRQLYTIANDGYGNHIRIDGLVFNGFRFEAGGDFEGITDTYGKPFINAAYNYRDSENIDSITNLEFRNCEFSGNSILKEAAETQRALYFDAFEEGAFNDIKFVNCTFDMLFQGLYITHVDGCTVSGCEFTNLGHNGIALQNYQSDPIQYSKGDIVITDNSFVDINDSPIGRGGFKDASITILDNYFFNSGDEDGVIVKLGNGGTFQKLINVDIRFTGNFNGTTAIPDIVRDISGDIFKINL